MCAHMCVLSHFSLWQSLLFLCVSASLCLRSISHFCVYMCVTGVLRDSKQHSSLEGNDDSPLLPPCCCVSSFLPSLPSSAPPRAFWDVAYHPTQLSFSQYVGVSAKRRQFPSRFPPFCLSHQLPMKHTHALSNTH